MRKKRKTREWSYLDYKLYGVWVNMRSRCNNPNCPAYRFYGQKTVRVCYLWEENFDAFVEWAFKAGYREGLTIDRINPYGDYTPRNCRWITGSENSKNTRRRYLQQFA